MKQITEDYVSFETAKLLKEKGFDDITFTWYTGKGKFCVGKNNFDDYHMNHLSNMETAKDKNKCSAPTLQVAMRWLREVFSIHISVYPFNRTLPITDKTVYTCDIATKEYSSQEGHIRGIWNTYEEAVEEAIKYCLENLI